MRRATIIYLTFILFQYKGNIIERRKPMKILNVLLAIILSMYFLSCTITTKPEKQCEMPTFSPTPGGYTSSESAHTISKPIWIYCATPGATIRYTTDGSDPNESSEIHDEHISVSFSYGVPAVVRAIAIKDGYKNSLIATGSYWRVY